MAKIFYGVQGEGRGHAARVHTIVEDLLSFGHEIVLFAPAHAYDFLAPIYSGTDVEVRRIDGINFHYNQSGKIHLPLTFVKGFEYLFNMNALVDDLARQIEGEAPDLVITDFEPAIAKAAEKVGAPFISINHQHFLTTYDLSSLPLLLQARAGLMANFLQMFYTGQRETVVSAFYFPRLRKGLQNVSQIGVLLRKEVLQAKPREDGHVLAYLRRFAPENVMESLRTCDHPVKLYGLGKRKSEGNITYCDVDPHTFIDDLASSRALITTAGNQVVGESLYLGKPVFAFPEPGNFEQQINGHFLQESGAGRSMYMEHVKRYSVSKFLDTIDTYRSNIDKERLYGNDDALRIIHQHLDDMATIPYEVQKEAV